MLAITQSSIDRSTAETGSVRRAALSRNHLVPVLLFILAIAYLSLFLRYSALEPDEGIVLAGAERILHGQLPYRDFFSFYTPGSFYLVAALFSIFGDTFVVARFSIAVTGAFLAAITFVLVRRVCTRGIAFFVSLIAIVAGVAFRFLVLHNWYSTLFACLALYAALRLIETHANLWALATGFLCSLTVLFEQSKGTGLCLGLALGFLTLRIRGQRQLFQAKGFWYIAVGFLAPVSAVLVYFATQHSLAIMVEDWLWPLHHYTASNRVPYGYQNWSNASRNVIFHAGPAWIVAVKVLAVSPGLYVPALPLIAIVFYVYWSFRVRRGDKPYEKCSYYIVVSGASLGLFASVIVSRADVIHFMYLIPLWLVVLAWILNRPNIYIRSLASSPITVIVALTFGLMGLSLLSNVRETHQRMETRRGVIATNRAGGVIDYVQAHNPPRSAMLVYPYLPLYYYLTETRSIAALDYFQPGMNTPEQAQEIITALVSHPESAVLFDPSFSQKYGTSWPGTPLGAIARDPVGDYIVRSYHICRLLSSTSDSTFLYMVRREKDCP